jgi:hypothetical protein
MSDCGKKYMALGVPPALPGMSWKQIICGISRLGGSLSKKPKNSQYRIFCSEIAIASSRPARRRRSEDVKDYVE